jgi:hypothetical protein
LDAFFFCSTSSCASAVLRASTVATITWTQLLTSCAAVNVATSRNGRTTELQHQWTCCKRRCWRTVCVSCLCGNGACSHGRQHQLFVYMLPV